MSEEGTENTEFKPPLTFSEDGKTVTWQKSETEKVEFPTEEIDARFNKAVLADKQGQELGEARKRLTDYETRYGDIEKQLADAEDPEAVLAKMRQAVEGKPAATDTETGADDWLKGLLSDDSTQGPSLAEVEAKLLKAVDKKVDQRLAGADINKEIDTALVESGIPNKELREGFMLHDVIADVVLQLGAKNNIPYPELVQSVNKAIGEAWTEKTEADAKAEAERVKAQGATLDDLGRPIDLGGKRPEVNWDDPESVKAVAARIEARLG